MVWKTYFDSFPNNIYKIHLLYYNVNIVTIYSSIRIFARGLPSYYISGNRLCDFNIIHKKIQKNMRIEALLLYYNEGHELVRITFKWAK